MTRIKYGELVRAMGMGSGVLASKTCEDCGAPKSMHYNDRNLCFTCWSKPENIEPKKKNFKKKKEKAK
jgi:hypothetical protein